MELSELGRRLLRAGGELAAHTAVMVMVLLSIWMVEKWFHLLWGSSKLIFGSVPMQWLVDAADLYAFLAFAYFGIGAAIEAYRGAN